MARPLLFLAALLLFLVLSASAHGDHSDSGSSTEEKPHLRSRSLILVKIWCLILVFVGTFAGGMSPYFMKWSEGFLILGTQFAGGVFLGTALMHFLSDSNATFGDLTSKEYPFAFMLASAGYLLTMWADCVVSHVYGKHGDVSANGSAGFQGNSQSASGSRTKQDQDPESRWAKSSLTKASSLGDSVLLIVALCFHSVFEGIAIGVAETRSDAWRALWTVCLHKIFAAIAMGIALLRMIPDRPLLSCVAYAFAFAISSPVGVAIGIIIDATTQGPIADWIYAVSMGVACGVFIYVSINHLLSKGYKPEKEVSLDTPGFRFMAVLLGVGPNLLDGSVRDLQFFGLFLRPPYEGRRFWSLQLVRPHKTILSCSSTALTGLSSFLVLFPDLALQSSGRSLKPRFFLACFLRAVRVLSPFGAFEVLEMVPTMAINEHYFVEWKEQYVSKERGNRVVHYFLKDNSGESILAIVGTERSVRHMFYVVSEEFVSAHGAESSVQAGFRWRSRREVVNWLTSMLSKQQSGDFAVSHKDNPTLEDNIQQTQALSHKGHLAKNSKGHHLGISWSGSAWACGKQLKHYPAFCRNGISIAVQSFVFVMAEEENHYIAYLEDMYEDRKGHKKVKVRWFHHNREVKGVVSLRNPHPKEVFITPYIQVISAECVDGPAIVLTREHYEKCLSVFPQDLLGRVHFCLKQFKSSKIKPFKLSKLRGYFNQPIFSCFSPDFFDEKEVSSEDDVKAGSKRNRSSREFNKSRYDLSYKKYDLTSREPNFLKHDEARLLQHTPVFAVNEKVEFLCQDSGLRGCWFRCTVLEVSRRQMKVLYDDIKDEDSCSNLEEWIPTNRVAKADKLGVRHPGRSTVRPAYPCNEGSANFEVGHSADAWWNDGWWEGVISGTSDDKVKNLRVSKDWVFDGGWVDVEPNPHILGIISANNVDATADDNCPTPDHKVEEEVHHDLVDMTLTNVPLKDDSTNNDKENNSEHVNNEKEEYMDCDERGANNEADDIVRISIEDGSGDHNLVECEIAELECEGEEAMEILTSH
ncbi:zinc transporter [Striga asiatica]|uniref:Zinc transporter n=1 Tax=Striga asiatica TaxID=4170 RepID=A0A5A7PJR2_STRAF|nr:zinc transporter [Striga asiatica]